MMRIFYGFRLIIAGMRIAFRFLTGRPMSGERKTNATFTRHATRSLDPSGTALRWEMLPGYQRALWRILGLYVIGLLLSSGILWPFRGILPGWADPELWLILHGSVAGILLARWWILRRIRLHGIRIPYPVREEILNESTEETRKVWRIQMWALEGSAAWDREVTLPLGRALSSMLSLPGTDREIRRSVRIPRDFHSGTTGEILLPDIFTGADAGMERRMAATIQARLGLRDKDPISITWSLGGSAPRVTFKLPEKIPALVTFADLRPYLEGSGEWDYVYGVTGGGSAFSVSVTDDTPHGAISAGSGAGKSELLKGKIAQAGHKGWNLIILDWKGESQEWAKGISGVRYVSSTEAIHDMCVQIGEEIDYRKELPKGTVRPPIMVVAEEWGITAPLLAEYWSIMRSTADLEEKRTMPLRSPALSAMMKLVFCGRSLGLFEELVAQRFSARVTNGNADLRESFGVIMMARWKPQTVKMLAPDVKPFPKKPRELGRWVAVDGERAVMYQAALWTDSEAEEWFLSGEPIPMSPWMTRGYAADLAVASQRITQEDPLHLDAAGRSAGVIEGEVVDARKLSEMVDGLTPLGVTLNVLRLAANSGPKNDPTFPSPVGGAPNGGYTYDYSEVRQWARIRFSARAAEKIGR